MDIPAAQRRTRASPLGSRPGASHFGRAWTAGALALVLCAFAAAIRMRGRDSHRWIFLNLSALAAFLYTRSMAGHAASDGDFGMRILVDWVHLVLISVWVGEVVVAGVLTLASPPAAAPTATSTARTISWRCRPRPRMR